MNIIVIIHFSYEKSNMNLFVDMDMKMPTKISYFLKVKSKSKFDVFAL